jgi:hypothetical protein
VNLTSLTTSGLTDLHFANPSQTAGASDLLVFGSGGLTVNPGTAISFGTDPTVAGDYPLISDAVDALSTSGFVLPAAPSGVHYSLAVVGSNLDLVVAVPEPGTLALLAAGLMGLLGLAWRRRNAG